MGRISSVTAHMGLCYLLTLVTGLTVTPVQQVIDMLGEMKAKGTTSASVERQTFASYKEFVDDRIANLGFEITTLKRVVEKQIASIDKMDSDVAAHGSHIADLDK